MKVACAFATDKGPRFFTGQFVARGIPLPIPYTTLQPDRARTYDDRNVAQLVTEYLNLIAGVHAGAPRRNWIVVDLPDSWTSGALT